MKEKNRALRAEAEARLKSLPELSENPTMNEVKTLLHELRVYQVELEMQNEELRKAQQRLEESRDQYTDLFEFAPMGYFLLDKNGLVLDCNLTGCNLLGIPKSHLKNKPLSIFIAEGLEEIGRYRKYLKKVFESTGLQSCELKLKRVNNTFFTARLDTLVIKNETGLALQCRMAVNDITNEKKTEKLLALTEQLQKEKEKLRNSEAQTMNAILEAQEKERNRIAADLHDSINPLLSMARLNADALTTQFEKGKDLEKDQLDNIIFLLENALRGIKEISTNLSPALLKDFGLSKALENLCTRLKKTGQINVEYLSHGIEERIEPKIELNLYRMAQELLNNIIKHADASETEVQLIRHPTSIVLMVGDNGIGFNQPVEELKTNGFGFKNISSRVRVLNGSMDIDSTRGKGTTITIELPLWIRKPKI